MGGLGKWKWGYEVMGVGGSVGFGGSVWVGDFCFFSLKKNLLFKYIA